MPHTSRATPLLLLLAAILLLAWLMRAAKLLILAALLTITACLPAAAGSLSNLPKLGTMTTAVSQEATRGDWVSAHNDAAKLKGQWVAIRPSVATTRLPTAHAETIDASIAWMTAAIDGRHVRSVQDSATFVVRTINHFVEVHSQR